MECELCGDYGWICEEHPNYVMGHDGCRGAGDPCPLCNHEADDRFDMIIAEVE